MSTSYKFFPASNSEEDEVFAALVNAVSGEISESDYTLNTPQEFVGPVRSHPEQALQNIGGTGTSNTTTCPHRLVPGACWFCTQEMDASFRSMHVNTSSSAGETSQARGRLGLMDVLGRRKLYLVLDLDHTLLHSVHLEKLTREEDYLCLQRERLPDSLHRLEGFNLFTKLRPFVHSFLREASRLFEMYIFTRGDRTYALHMAKLLDPENVYFDNYSRLMAREDFPTGNKKSLDIFRGQENVVVILDDTEEVWGTDKSNLVVAERYFYFAASPRCFGSDANFQSHSILRTDESEELGGLAIALNVLRGVYAEFFNLASENQDLVNRDVRQVLRRRLVGRSLRSS